MIVAALVAAVTVGALAAAALLAFRRPRAAAAASPSKPRGAPLSTWAKSFRYVAVVPGQVERGATRSRDDGYRVAPSRRERRAAAALARRGAP